MLKVISNPPAESSPKMDENKAKALQAALSQIEKQFGKGSIMKMGDADVEKGIQVVSTGSLGLDMALGVGGLPRGRVVEIYGPESSGKTTLTLQVIANIQKLGGTRPSSMRSTRSIPSTRSASGVDTSELLLSQPTTASRRSRSPTCSCARPRSTAW
jgi:recombination protein RecA